ncbi:MAG: DUF4430 domain-containing protein [Candidatus Doudnabacteria bacterium]|nr:DUF4430 domain-containing protein [Candidatus Doudnabacteria bacterium]
MNYFKRIETGIIAVIILVLAVAFGLLNEKASAPTTNDNAQDSLQSVQQENQVTASFYRYPGEDGRSALDILKSKHNVVTQDFGDLGEFVQAIDGSESDSSHFWALYVNGSQSQVGGSQYVTKSTDTIEWKLEEIK